MSIQDPEDNTQLRLTALAVFQYLLISLMMACFVFILSQALLYTLLNSAISYLPHLCFFIALESCLTQRHLRKLDPFTGQWIGWRITEIVVLTIIVKLIGYGSTGWDRLASESLLWDDNPMTFFSRDYMIALIVVGVIWFIAGQMSGFLLDLEDNPDQMELEREGIAVKDRRMLRRALSGWVFTLGSLLLVVNGLYGLGVKVFPQAAAGLEWTSLAVLVYFLCGLLILALTQLTMLRMRWALRRIPYNATVSTIWVGLSLFVIFAAGVAAFLLPTRYSLGLLATLQLILGYGLFLLAILQLILFTPIIYLVNLLATWIGQGKPLEPISPPAAPEPMAPPGIAFSDPLWVEILRSFLFWGVLLGIIFLSFQHYFRQRRGYVDAVRQVNWLTWLKTVYERLRSLLFGARRDMGKLINSGFSGINKLRRGINLPTPHPLPILRWLPPRQQVLLSYHLLMEWNQDHGFPRKKNQTPSEYMTMLANIFPNIAEELQTATNLFITARYTNTPIQREQAALTLEKLQVIRRVIHQLWLQTHPDQITIKRSHQ